MHRYEHALVVLRDLRRARNDLLSPGRACQSDDLKALEHINAAIKHIESAERLMAVRELMDGSHVNGEQSLITEALRHIDWHSSTVRWRGNKIRSSFGMTPQPEPPAELRADD